MYTPSSGTQELSFNVKDSRGRLEVFLNGEEIIEQTVVDCVHARKNQHVDKRRQPRARAIDEPQALGGDSIDHAVFQMFLMLVGRDRWK